MKDRHHEQTSGPSADGPSGAVGRRELLSWLVSLGAVATGASVAGCSQPGSSPAQPRARSELRPSAISPTPPIIASPGDGFSPNATMNPDEMAGLAAPPTVPAAAVRARPVFTVHDLLPDAPPDAVALTIDDGPDPHWTPQVLALLARYRVRATFSLVGVEAHAHKDIVARIVQEGHAVCNHSMTHPQPFARRPPGAIEQEIELAQAVLVEAAGVPPRLFRSPGGDWSPEVLAAAARHGLTPIDWDIDPRDWARPGPARIVRRLLAAKPGDILLCHDGGGNRAQTVEALRTALPRLIAHGYQFVTL
ncbi:polysaccharide deacetylase family protein [Frankia sp. R82]|uniref:polysaccharide deacetylase family protein n=1 Tax=Frankia sp. R82 TaxID=2950553 RepID=UPI00204342E5|nr:polysaccharide deacetylase family protein [Frankia sp. R82]MCM3883354.1 polysaccharide deacetylase family protein [Frankia sp. R82]